MTNDAPQIIVGKGSAITASKLTLENLKNQLDPQLPSINSDFSEN